MSEMFSQGEIDRIIADSWHEWQEQEPSEDAISRAEVHDLLATWLSDKLDEKTREVLEVIDGKVEDMPSVTPMQRTGHWIECEDEVKCFCSECKEISDYPTKFCPNCGAWMIKQQESEG